MNFRTQKPLRWLGACLLLTAIAGHAAAQVECGQWSQGYAINKLGGRIHASAIFDDGQGGGPALYVAGEFRIGQTSGQWGIAKWNGLDFEPVGGGLDGSAFALTVFDDDGAGPNPPALYVGGSFTLAGVESARGVARWNGVSWSGLGSGVTGTVYALKGHDAGSGPALYVGGDFFEAGGAFALSLAAYRDGAWEDVGGGVALGGFVGSVTALETFQGALFVGGFFDQAGEVTTNALVRWNGSSFENLGTGVSYAGSLAQVTSLLSVNLPSTGGAALIVGGTMDAADGAGVGQIARWDGDEFTNMNSGGSQFPIGSLGVHNDGTGSALYAGGILPGGAGVSKWTGTQWELVGGVPQITGVPHGVDTLLSVPSGLAGAGTRLFAGGMFSWMNGAPAPWAATLRNGAWTGLGDFGLGFDGPVNAMKVLDLGDGPHLYAAGSFKMAGGVPAAGVARMAAGGGGWQAIATSMQPASAAVRSIEAFDGGGGPALYIGGAFNNVNGLAAANVARWRPAGMPGAGWSSAGAGLSSSSSSVFGGVFALQTHQDPGAPSPSLFATGLIQFTGSTPITNVARFNGTSWSSVGTGAGPDGTGGATLASLDLDGPGGNPARLYFGGVFLPVASWDGTAWTEIHGLNTTVVSSVGAFDFGDGFSLFAGGDITSPFIGSVAKRTGEVWENVGLSPRFPHGAGSGGSAAFGSVMDTLEFTDTFGHQLYMTGIFGELRVEGYRNVARWTGANWTGLGGGLASRFPGPDGRGAAMASFNDGTGPGIFVGGKFERYYTNADDTAWRATYNIARWIPCVPPPACPAEFNNDGSLNADDLGDYITCYFSTPPCPQAEFNNDGTINADDLGDYITAYFTGCP